MLGFFEIMFKNEVNWEGQIPQSKRIDNSYWFFEYFPNYNE